MFKNLIAKIKAMSKWNLIFIGGAIGCAIVAVCITYGFAPTAVKITDAILGVGSIGCLIACLIYNMVKKA